MLKPFVLLAFLMAGAFSSAKAHQQNDTPPTKVKVSELALGLFELRTDKSGNVVVSIGEDGVLMVDTQMEHLIEAIDTAQRKLSGDRSVDLVINTHLHRDHVRGNHFLRKHGATILSHTNTRKYLEQPRAIKSLGRGTPQGTHAHLPSIVVGEGTSIHMNGQTIRLIHTPEAHTDGDIFVYFEDANVIHAGDLLYSNRFPFIDIDNGGSVGGYIAGMEAILATGNANTVIVAGHGPTSTREDLQKNILMLQETHRRVRTLVDQGLKLADIIRLDPLADYRAEWDWEFINADRMTTIHYYDLTGRLE